MAQVAVSEIHIDKKAVDNMKPRSSSLGEVPTTFRTYRDIRLWRLVSSIAIATSRPVARN